MTKSKTREGMFRRTRIKIVSAVMAALLVFVVLMVVIIYSASSYSIRRENRLQLQEYASNFMNNGFPPEYSNDGPGQQELPDGSTIPPLPDGESGPGGEGGTAPENEGQTAPENEGEFKPDGRVDEHIMKLATFYYVMYETDGSVSEVYAGGRNTYTEEELTEAAEKVRKSGKSSGSSGGLDYMTATIQGKEAVLFMDNTVSYSNLRTLLRTMLITAAISLCVIFVIAILLARLIVKPLEENDARQRQFVSDAGHELKTPVAVIDANAELLSREIGENEWLSNIRYENERMGNLVRELLDLSRAESGKVAMERLDLSRLVTGEALPFESVAFERGFTLEYDVQDNIFVSGNATQLRQLTAILLDNALRHSEGSNLVQLSLTSSKKKALLSVENSAPAISEKDREHLFERFYRPDSARTGDDGHYGLGLAIARSICEAHGGRIGVDCRDGKVIFTAEIPEA